MLPRPTEQEKTRISILRKKISDISLLRNNHPVISEPEWSNNNMILRDNIMKRDPRNFLRWHIVLYTMFYSGKIEELEYLKNLPDWAEYNTAIKESSIGNPKPYQYFPKSSGNLIHHAYSIALFSETFSINIKPFHCIFEFGGGYGSLARFVYHMGFAGQYVIFDSAEFSCLQEYYLSSIPDLAINFNNNNKETQRTVSLVTSIDQSIHAIGNKSIDVFIALWSISEVPIELREVFFKKINSPSYFLIAYQENYNDIDNVIYFNKFIAEHPEYTWIHFPISHIPGNRYLFGKKK